MYAQSKPCCNIYYSTDLNKRVVKDNCEKRGWIKVKSSAQWNIYWASSHSCRQLFKRESPYIMNNHQLISHFPNSYILCRKDFLPKAMNKYVRELEKIVSESGEPKKNVPRIIPLTFTLPQDYMYFLKAYEHFPNSTWIMKPCCKSQGYGIYLTNDLKKFKKWEKRHSRFKIERAADNNAYVVSKYIANPLLISGKKFDLRLYVLVTSFQPLKAYLFKHGFCRFCTLRYDSNTTKFKNHYIHLTNVSVQRRGRSYNHHHGGKWSIENFKLYLEGTQGHLIANKLFDDIYDLIIHSLKAVQPAISSDMHCFECYGYDIIIDNSLRPWLIEVNSSPAITSTTRSDRVLKRKLLDNIFSVVVSPTGLPDIRWNKIPTEQAMGNFIRLIDEDLLPKCAPKHSSCLSMLSVQSLACRRAISSKRFSKQSLNNPFIDSRLSLYGSQLSMLNGANKKPRGKLLSKQQTLLRLK